MCKKNGICLPRRAIQQSKYGKPVKRAYEDVLKKRARKPGALVDEDAREDEVLPRPEDLRPAPFLPVDIPLECSPGEHPDAILSESVSAAEYNARSLEAAWRYGRGREPLPPEKALWLVGFGRLL